MIEDDSLSEGYELVDENMAEDYNDIREISYLFSNEQNTAISLSTITTE